MRCMTVLLIRYETTLKSFKNYHYHYYDKYSTLIADLKKSSSNF